MKSQKQNEPEGNQAQMLIRKELGKTATVGELLDALNFLPANKDNILVVQTENHSDYLSIAYCCGSKDCNSLHLIAGLSPDRYIDSSTGEMFIDKSRCDDVVYVKKNELIEVLKKLERNKEILIKTTKDKDDSHFYLGAVLMCGSCDCIHLDSAYYPPIASVPSESLN